MMIEYVNFSLINTLDECRTLSDAIMKGFIAMPNISKLAKQLNKDRKTVRKALVGIQPSKTRTRTKYLDQYRHIILELLEDEYKEFDYFQHMYNYLKREHRIECSYSTFKRYIKCDEELSNKFNKSTSTVAFTERFETEAGVQAQFDLKERILIVDREGQEHRVNVATLTLGFSRLNVRKVVPDTSFETIISFLAEAMDELDGVPKELVIDNIKCLVDKPRTHTTDALLNVKFEQFLKDYQIECKACMPYRPQTKGKTETQNKVPSQLKNYNGTYVDINDVNEILKVINSEDNNNVSQATGFPATFLFQQEKDRLQALPTTSIRQNYYLKLKEVIVSNESLISYQSNKYSVPKDYIGHRVGRIVKNNKLHIYYNTELVCIHEITNKKLNIKASHQLNYVKPLESEPIGEVSSTSTVDDYIKTEMENINYDNI